MGKIKHIKSCRKEQKCSKCGEIIPVGSPYYKGEMFRRSPIVRCTKCGLKGYEVTTSEYVQRVGRLVEDWQEDYSIGSCTVDDISTEVQDILDVCDENFNNIPEQFQDGDAGTLLQERIGELECVISEFDCFDWNEILSNAYDEVDEEVQSIIDEEQSKRDDADYDDWYEEFCDDAEADEVKREAAGCWQEKVEEQIISFIENALGQLSY